jgi:aspartate aminotransferase-like enzyme
MPGLLPDVDPDGLLEYSVVYTDRSLNHMSRRFSQAMQDISATLKEVYGAASAIVVPGSGSFGMEAVARQFAGGKDVLIVRNGWFSYRWTQIFEMAGVASSSTVLKARMTSPAAKAPFAPAPLDEIVATIRSAKTTSSPSPTPCTRMAASSCWTAWPRARCGWTCAPPASTCSSARRRRAGAARRAPGW